MANAIRLLFCFGFILICYASPIAKVLCLNGGTIVQFFPGEHSCLCPVEYQGWRCEYASLTKTYASKTIIKAPTTGVRLKSPGKCLHGGTLIQFFPGKRSCLCTKKYHGPRCGKAVKPNKRVRPTTQKKEGIIL